MAKTQFHACAMADIHINDVDDFYYDVCMAQSDLKIRSPDIDVDASGITPEILRGINRSIKEYPQGFVVSKIGEGFLEHQDIYLQL